MKHFIIVVVVVVAILLGCHHCLPHQGNKMNIFGKLEIVSDKQPTHPFSEEFTNDQCFTKAFQESMFIEECGKTVRYENNYCFGSCNSIFVPSYSYKSCKACIPSEYEHKSFTFVCMDKEITRTLILIKECQCLDVICSKNG